MQGLKPNIMIAERALSLAARTLRYTHGHGRGHGHSDNGTRAVASPTGPSPESVEHGLMAIHSFSWFLCSAQMGLRVRGRRNDGRTRWRGLRQAIVVAVC